MGPRARILTILTSATIVMLGLSLFSTAAQQAVESRVKVHKHLIQVSAPDRQNRVHVSGRAGAIESTSAVQVQLVNLATNSQVPLAIAPDGSFNGTIAAQVNQKVRIVARNVEKKRSIGTFPVPAAATVDPAPVILVPPSTPVQFAPTVQPAVSPSPQLLSAGEDQLPIAIFVNAVDMRTGQLLGSQRIDIVIDSKKTIDGDYGRAVIDLLRQVSTAVQLPPSPSVPAVDQSREEEGTVAEESSRNVE